jgi:hypothetical protein
MPLYKKKESLTSKYSKIPNVIYCEGKVQENLHVQKFQVTRCKSFFSLPVRNVGCGYLI